MWSASAWVGGRGGGGGREEGRRVQAVPVAALKQRLERGARVDEDGRSTRLVADQIGVREPARVHAAFDDHGVVARLTQIRPTWDSRRNAREAGRVRGYRPRCGQ